MKTEVKFTNDMKTGEVYDFQRVHEILEKLPESKLREKLVKDLSWSEKKLTCILRNTSQRLYQNIGLENVTYNGAYVLNIFPDGWRGLETLSFSFCFTFFDGKTEKRDFNGGIIFHGVHKIYNEDFTLKENVDYDDDSQASISTHT